MNHKHEAGQNAVQQNNGEYAVHRSHRTNIIAAAVCILLALVVWIVIMSRQDSDFVAVRVIDPQEGYTYSFSTELLELKGSVGDLRHIRYVGVKLPENAPGEYHLTLEDLELPDGVQLASDLNLTLTVKAE